MIFVSGGLPAARSLRLRLMAEKAAAQEGKVVYLLRPGQPLERYEPLVPPSRRLEAKRP